MKGKDMTDDLAKDQKEALVKPKMSLSEIFDLMERLTDGLLSLTEEDHIELAEQFAQKPDDYKFFTDKVEAEISHFDKVSKEFSKAKSTLQNTLDSIYDRTVFLMKQSGWDCLFGNLYKLKYVCTKANKLVIKPGFEEPTAQTMLEHPEFVKRSYSWKSKEIKDALKSNKIDSGLKEIFSLKDSESIRFSVKKPTDKQLKGNENE
jgi:hypothetical protein